jgi:hypothetical protein
MIAQGIGQKQGSFRMAHLVRYGDRAGTAEILGVHVILKRKKLQFLPVTKTRSVGFFKKKLT